MTRKWKVCLGGSIMFKGKLFKQGDLITDMDMPLAKIEAHVKSGYLRAYGNHDPQPAPAGTPDVPLLPATDTLDTSKVDPRDPAPKPDPRDPNPKAPALIQGSPAERTTAAEVKEAKAEVAKLGQQEPKQALRVDVLPETKGLQKSESKKTAPVSPWVFDPRTLAQKDLDSLNVMIAERDDNGPVCGSIDEAVRFLSKDFQR